MPRSTLSAKNEAAATGAFRKSSLAAYDIESVVSRVERTIRRANVTRDAPRTLLKTT